MSKPTKLYIGMAVVAIVGLWLILQTGTIFSHPPVELGGVSHTGAGGTVQVEQSGLFCNVAFNPAPSTGQPARRLNMKLEPAEANATLTIRGGGWTLGVVLKSPDSADFVLSGNRTIPWHFSASGALSINRPIVGKAAMSFSCCSFKSP